MKKRRKRRKDPVNWPSEIAKGNVKAFYDSTDWDIVREAALKRDNHTCQFFLGSWNDGVHYPKRIEPVAANTVHHTYPIRKFPEYCLDLDKLVSLSFEAHEIIEERGSNKFQKKKLLTEEWW